MDSQEAKSLLEQAAVQLKEGNTKSARSLILQVLREDEENAQAWFMLSFSVPVADKQIYALQQALRYKPGSKKIFDRLQSLGGETDPDVVPPLKSKPGISPARQPGMF